MLWLQVIFIAAGGLAALIFGFVGVGSLVHLLTGDMPARWLTLFASSVVCLALAAYGLAFVLVGVRLRGLLATRSELVQRLVWVNLVLSAMSLNLPSFALTFVLLRKLPDLARREREAAARARPRGFEALDGAL